MAQMRRILVIIIAQRCENKDQIKTKCRFWHEKKPANGVFTGVGFKQITGVMNVITFCSLNSVSFGNIHACILLMYYLYHMWIVFSPFIADSRTVIR